MYPVPQYLRDHVPIFSKPGTPFSRNYVSQARNYVLSNLDAMYFHQGFDKKVE